MQQYSAATLYQMGVAGPLELSSVSVVLKKKKQISNFSSLFFFWKDPQPYSKSIAQLKKLSNMKTVNDKLNCLVSTCQSINQACQEYFKKYSPKDGLVTV